MKPLVLSSLMFTLFPVFAADAVKAGQELKSPAGVEKIVAAASVGADSYWISAFVRAGDCPAKSGKCANDVINVRGPGGVATITGSNFMGTTGAVSQGNDVVAVALVPSYDGGYVSSSAQIFIFDAAKKPLLALKTEEVIVSNAEGAACIGQKLCADSKFSVVFQPTAPVGYPNVVLRQVGTALNNAATGIDKIDRNFTFVFDPKSKRYVPKK